MPIDQTHDPERTVTALSSSPSFRWRVVDKDSNHYRNPLYIGVNSLGQSARLGVAGYFRKWGSRRSGARCYLEEPEQIHRSGGGRGGDRRVARRPRRAPGGELPAGVPLPGRRRLGGERRASRAGRGDRHPVRRRDVRTAAEPRRADAGQEAPAAGPGRRLLPRLDAAVRLPGQAQGHSRPDAGRVRRLFPPRFADRSRGAEPWERRGPLAAHRRGDEQRLDPGGGRTAGRLDGPRRRPVRDRAPRLAGGPRGRRPTRSVT